MINSVALSPDVTENIQKWIDVYPDGGQYVFGAKLKPTDGKGHIQVFTTDSQFMNEFNMDEVFDTLTYHEPSNPKCSVCKVRFKEFIGMDKIEARLYPGCSSTEGFLRRDEKLQDVINEDEMVLKSLNVTFDQIADRLKVIQEKAIKAIQTSTLDKPVIVEGLKVKLECYLGYQGCPWGCENEQSSVDFIITDPNTNQSFFCSQLHPHLIKKHKFFEGHTEYRLNPKVVIEVLKLGRS
jgi:hypothetical protein